MMSISVWELAGLLLVYMRSRFVLPVVITTVSQGHPEQSLPLRWQCKLSLSEDLSQALTTRTFSLSAVAV